MEDLTLVVDRLQANNLRHNWPMMKPATKLRVLNQFGVSADSVDAMQHALDELLAEFGGSLVMHILLNPDLTVIEALEEVA